MSDKIIVLSKRPAIIKNIFNIKFDKGLNVIEKRNTKEFSNYYNEIWSEIDV